MGGHEPLPFAVPGSRSAAGGSVRRWGAGLLVAASGAAALAGCSSTRVEPAPPAPSTARGAVSYEQLQDPSARPAVVDAEHEYVRPRLDSGFALPAYPPEALAGGAPPHEIVVRLLIATDGSVARVEPSPLAVLPQGDWSELFLACVVLAVSEWRYDPCELRTLAAGPDIDGDGKPDYRTVVAATPVPVYLDIAFRFEIVDGAGRVSLR